MSEQAPEQTPEPQPQPQPRPHLEPIQRHELPPTQPYQSPPSAVLFKIFKPTDTVTRLLAPLPDEYFEPTAADLRDAQTTLIARSRALTEAPLQLRTTRDAIEKAKRDRWPFTRIRVRFADRTQLERVFPSTDRIKSVYVFVRELLRDDVKPIKFILYQSPPKRDLKVSDPAVKGLSLSELQLAPASVLLLRFEDDSLNHVNVTAPLLPQVLIQAVDLPIPSESDRPYSQSSPADQPSGVSKILSNSERKQPKWFKLGKK